MAESAKAGTARERPSDGRATRQLSAAANGQVALDLHSSHSN
jgi:hypothetical protein